MPGPMLCSLLLAAVLVGTPGPAATSPVAPQPYTVIAQGLVELTEGTYAWSHTAHEISATTVAIESGGSTFLLARGDGAVVLDGSDGSRALLADCEAVLGAGAPTTWTAIALAESGGDAAPTARIDAIALIAAEASGGGFAPGAGWHDVELRHIDVAAGAAVQPPPGNPALAMVGAGTVADAAGTTIEAGGTIMLASAGATLTNVGEQTATVVVAVIGPALDTTSDAAASASTTATSPPAPPTTTTTTSTPAIDLDGDGLSDDEEAGLGTDHNNPDTDGDTLSDGEEVETHGTDPLDIDTDDDELPDAGEIVTYGSDPLDPDTDDDGLYDIEPVNWGTGPTNPDTDDDGLNDGQEVNGYGSNPHVTDSDGDSLGDGDEVNPWGSDPSDTDSDDDGLVDGEEVNGTHTEPANADTDGDTIDDGTEAGNGTDPNDPNDP